MKRLFKKFQRLWRKGRQEAAEDSVTVRKCFSRFSLFSFKNSFSDALEDAGHKVDEEMFHRKR
jgi:hypothetical protein